MANGGGACVYGQEPYNSGNGIYIADIYDCSKLLKIKTIKIVFLVSAPKAMSNVKAAMEGVYDIHPSSDGICCPNRG
jgi:hypothetical protein